MKYRNIMIKTFGNLPFAQKFKKSLILLIKLLLILGFVLICTQLLGNELNTNSKNHDPGILAALKNAKDESIELIDWHNYTQMKLDKQRIGPGEQGKPADSSNISAELKAKYLKENGYNGALSDLISVHRSVQDVRPPNCSKILYRKNLPSASVIIPFHDEHLSVLLRTICSILDRSPPSLIKEIILVDDCSTKEMLKDKLDQYVKEHLPKVKIIRLKLRQGLINARLVGARAATAEVLIYFDAHCEVNINWLPPLLDLIAQDYKTCVCPFVGIIDTDTFEFIGCVGGRGVFDWDLVWRIFHKFKKYGPDSTEPFPNPVMVGGLFAISAKFFWELGGYDEGLYIWGGEQFELSFKIWQCGGRLLDVPCSHVCHIYRQFYVFKEPEKKVDYLCMNLRRVAEVWMDDYKQYYYRRHPDCAKMDYGDISKQLALREKLKCKPFKWFMEEVAYDVTNRYPFIDPPDIAFGQIRSVAHPDICVETTETKNQVSPCSDDKWEQSIKFSWRGEIRNSHYTDGSKCWDAPYYASEDWNPILMYDCHQGAGSQLWKYHEENKTLVHVNTNQCLDMNMDQKSIFMKHCNSKIETQKWTLQNFRKSQQDELPNFLKRIIIDEK